MKQQPIPQPKKLTHIYVRDAQKGFVRPCWSSGSELYCGMCMRGEVQAVVGSVCPICSSTVERVFEVTPGGKPSFARWRKECSIRVADARQQTNEAVLLEFRGSRKVRA